MSTDETVARLCRLPVDFYGGSKSMVQLVADSGIEEHPETLTVVNMMRYIATHPELIEAWLRWSENKRVTSGWYFSRRAARFDVGFLPEGDVSTYSDPSLACAEFVIREVNSLMEIRRAKPNR
jgi:hypothetical protein